MLTRRYFFLILLSIPLCYCALEIGDKCGPRDEWRCVRVLDCDEAVQELRNNNAKHSFKRCGFDGLIELVSCDVNLSVRVTKFGRPSVMACNSFNTRLNVGDILTFHIYGGENATLGEFPFMAAVGFNNTQDRTIDFECGGSLISNDFVLTAAHCMLSRNNITVVRLGKVDIEGNADGADGQDIPVEKLIMHDDYDPITREHDIGLIKLSRSADVSGKNVQPVCLHTDGDEPEMMTIMGWGEVSNKNQRSRFLLKTAVSRVVYKECNETLSSIPLSNPVYPTQICAKSNDTTPRDTCQGDSGGPMVHEKQEGATDIVHYLVGITSYGKGCGTKIPSIYTKVSKYLDWIEKIVWPNLINVKQ